MKSFISRSKSAAVAPGANTVPRQWCSSAPGSPACGPAGVSRFDGPRTPRPRRRAFGLRLRLPEATRARKPFRRSVLLRQPGLHRRPQYWGTRSAAAAGGGFFPHNRARPRASASPQIGSPYIRREDYSPNWTARRFMDCPTLRPGPSRKAMHGTSPVSHPFFFWQVVRSDGCCRTLYIESAGCPASPPSGLLEMRRCAVMGGQGFPSVLSGGEPFCTQVMVRWCSCLLARSLIYFPATESEPVRRNRGEAAGGCADGLCFHSPLRRSRRRGLLWRKRGRRRWPCPASPAHFPTTPFT